MELFNFRIVWLEFNFYWANSAANILMILFLFYAENGILHFMQIVSSGDILHEISNPISGKSKKKLFQNVC